MRKGKSSGRNHGMPVSNCDPRDMEKQSREIVEMIEREKAEERSEIRARERELAKCLAEMPRIVRDHQRAKKKHQEMAANQALDNAGVGQGEGDSSDSQTGARESEGSQLDKRSQQIRRIRAEMMRADGRSLSTGDALDEKSRSRNRFFAASSIFSRLKGNKSHDQADEGALGLSAHSSRDSATVSETQSAPERDHDLDIASVGALRKQRLIKSRKLSSRLKRGFEVIFGLDKPEPLKDKLSIWLGENYKDKGTLRESLDFSDSESEHEEPTDHEEEEKEEEEEEEEKEVVEANGGEEVEDEFIYWRPAPLVLQD